MGRSPGKWIKTVLFGKKSSKSNLSKGREKAANEKDIWAPAKASSVNLDSDPPMAIHQASELVHGSERNLEENIRDGEITFPQNQSVVAQGITEVAEKNDPETIKLEEAATKAQAAFRGYLARRAFRALKGIIRLQALIRGHLVRRQAVSSLYCLLGIVKLQAYARGNKVRHSDIGIELRKKGILLKYLDGTVVAATNTSTQIAVSSNAFARKLLASSPTPMPLHLQYDSADLNSIFGWLERWSASRFWKPLPRPMKVRDSKPQKKQGNFQTSESESVRTKRSNRKVPAGNVDGTLSSATSEFEKPKRNIRKVISHPVDLAQEHPQSELEKVKRNLRKVHNPVTEGLVQSDLEIEKSKPIVAKISNSSDAEAVEEIKSYPTENLKDETNGVVPKIPAVETAPEPAVETEVVNTGHEEQSSPPQLETTDNIEKDENFPKINGENLKEDSSNKEVKKSAHTTPATVKQEHAENGLKSSPTLPSYMAATESAKAKLRGQSSPRLGQDSAEKPDVTRRHSLPSPTNGKISSQSPRTQRPAQPGAKGGKRATKDGTNGKVVQAEWRR